MNDDQLDDLKQYIAATVSQAELRLERRIGNVATNVEDLRKNVKELREEIKIVLLELARP